MKNGNAFLGALLIAAILGAVGYGGYRAGEAAERKKLEPVKVIQVSVPKFEPHKEFVIHVSKKEKKHLSDLPESEACVCFPRSGPPPFHCKHDRPVCDDIALKICADRNPAAKCMDSSVAVFSPNGTAR
jgi:hypothetical protein